MTIKVSVLEPSTLKEIAFECPECGHLICSMVEKDIKHAEIRCAYCEALLEWREEGNDN